VDSGNGQYLLYRLDLPNDGIVKATVKQATLAVKREFDAPDAVIDQTVTNAARLIKLPGTMNRKGDDTPERPWRRCRIIHIPDPLEPVTLAALQAVAGLDAPAAPPAPASPFVGLGGSGSAAAYARKALDEEAGRVLSATPGAKDFGRNATLNRAAYSLGGLVSGGLLSRDEVEARLRAAALAAGLEPGETELTIRSGVEAGMAKPRAAPERGHERNGHAAAPPAPDGPAAYRASEVVPRKVEWLWPKRIPLGKLTTFAGVMGIGKTFLLCDIAARLSAGRAWPDLPDAQPEAADVLFISGEDDPEDTLVPRLIECGADLGRVWFLTLDELCRFTLASLGTLGRAAGQAARLKLVVIDPPTSYLGDVDDHKNSELRRLLTPLKHWAAAANAAVVFNTHLNKGGGAKVEAVFRVIGSVAWIAAVRAAHLVALDPDDPEKRLFVPMKSNLGRRPAAFGYTIEDIGDERGRVRWLGEVDVTADQAVNRERSKPRRVLASEWLVEMFRAKLEWPSDELFAAAREANVSRNAVFEAKDSLGLPKARKVVTEGGETCWYWWVPADWPPLAAPAEGEGEAPTA
jgi:hypothetical protein